MPGVSFSIWSVLIIIGAVQALFLFAALFTTRNNKTANRLLGLLLFIIGLHLIEYALAVTGLGLRFPHTIASTYPLLYCMGPLYYLYTRATLNIDFKYRRAYFLHFILPFLCLLFFLPFYIQSGDEKIKFVTGLVKEDDIVLPVSQFAFMIIHIVQTAIYVYFGYRFIKDRQVIFKGQSSNTLFGQKIGFLKKFSHLFFLWLFMYLLLVVFLFASRQNRIEVDYVTLLVTACLVYVLAYAVLNNPAIFREMVHFEKSQVVIDTVVPVKGPIKYKKSLLPDERTKSIKEILEKYFAEKKPYLDYDVRLPDIAAAVDVSTQQLSQVINKEFGQNFYDFVNSYRVEEAKKLLTDTNGDNLKVLAIAFDVGFNSKATFNRVFKKLTMLTPTEYKSRFGQK